jgi:hypothetical protein
MLMKYNSMQNTAGRWVNQKYLRNFASLKNFVDKSQLVLVQIIET